MTGDTPKSYYETISIKSNLSKMDSKIEVINKEGKVVGKLNVSALPPKDMVLNLIKVKRPNDQGFPPVNFTIPEANAVLNNCFKEVNTNWTINPMIELELDFDKNDNGYLSKERPNQEDYECLIQMSLFYRELYDAIFPLGDVSKFIKTANLFLYNRLGTLFGAQENGWFRQSETSNYGALNSSYQHNKRTIAHEMGHKLNFTHPFEEFNGMYQPNNPDVEALMDYINILGGFKIRAYQWKKI